MADQSASKQITKWFNCPWHNREELVQTYKCLYSDNLLDRQRGVKNVLLWESRISNLPLGISSTAAIVDVEIKDNLMKSSIIDDIPTIMRPVDLRNMYAFAITRFTNVICEKAEEMSRREMPSTTAAKTVQLPMWVVNMRNAAVHKNMPSLDELRFGAKCAKKWLDKHYWEPELSSFKDCIVFERFSKTDLQETIATYLDTVSRLMLASNLSQGEGMALRGELKSVVLRMEKFVSQNHKQFFETLIAPGIFLHDTTELGAFLEADPDYVVDGVSPLPDRLTDLWMPMITMLSEQNLMQEFLEALFKCQDQPSDTAKHIITGWCRLLLDTKMIYRTDLQDIPENKRPCLSWIRLMAACTKCPTKYSALLLPEIMEKVEALSDIKKSLLLVVVAIRAGMGVLEENGDPPPKKRVKTDISEENVRRAFSDDQECWNNSAIQIADDDIDWESTPLGTIFNPKMMEPLLGQKSTDEDSESYFKAAAINVTQGDSIQHDEVVGFCQIEDVYSETGLDMDEDESDCEPIITYSRIA